MRSSRTYTSGFWILPLKGVGKHAAKLLVSFLFVIFALNALRVLTLNVKRFRHPGKQSGEVRFDIARGVDTIFIQESMFLSTSICQSLTPVLLLPVFFVRLNSLHRRGRGA